MPDIKKIITIPFFLMGFLLAFGQEETAIGAQNDPLLENIHLHLNKAIFFKGEHLWFKAYVQDQLQELPSTATTNLHVGLFSKEGNAIAKKMFLVDNGIGTGDFKIDSTFVDDSYTLMAWTNYMKNFEVATPFLQKVTIVGNPKETVTNDQNGMTLLVYPEGQQIITGTFNNVGFVAYDKGLNPLKTSSVQLVDNDGALIRSNIKTNGLGQGRFRFFADPDKSYFLKVKEVNGVWVTKKLEINSYQEFGMSVNNSAKNVIVLTPKWSQAALHSRADTKYKVAIFNNNKISFTRDYVFGKDNETISVNRTDIPNGINTAVILDKQMQPLSHRMFFNKRIPNKRVRSVEVSYCLTQNKDSLQVDLILPEGNTMANVSMSVLPTQSSAYFPNNSISSSFMVQPYLKQRLVNGRYFFEGTKRTKGYQLDTRLLMEGPEKFHWNLRSIDTQNDHYKKENLITIKGKVLDADIEKEKQISVLSQSFGSIKFLDLSSNKDFQGNLPIYEGDSILVSVLNHKGKLRKPKAELYFNGSNERFFDYTEWLRDAKKTASQPALSEIDENIDLTRGTIALDEVVVTGNAKKTNKFQVNPVIEGRIIDKETQNKYKTFISYIRKLGFIIRSNYQGTGLGVFVFDSPNLHPVPVLINGMFVNPTELMNIPLSSIESLVYRKWLTPGDGPFISASLRYDFDALNDRGRFTKLHVHQGFSRVQSYFNPSYPDFSSQWYKKYGAIWWEGQLEINSEMPKSITIPLNGQKEVKVIIEGMAANGWLYENEQICSPFNNDYSNK
ncbi:MAG: hypothetical protein Aureis2KO_11240 [Aureisphaera sp.]